MRVTQEAAKAISGALREFGNRQEAEDGGEVYLVEDATVLFGSDGNRPRVFQGLSFEMVGRDFHVLPNLDLVVSETVGEGAEAQSEAYSIEDETFAASTSAYLLWRAEFLSKLKV